MSQRHRFFLRQLISRSSGIHPVAVQCGAIFRQITLMRSAVGSGAVSPDAISGSIADISLVCK